MSESKKLTTDVKKQHTVPRFLLDNFSFDNGGKANNLFTFDKLSQRVYQQSVYDASTRNTFYNIEGHPEQHSLEPILGEIEAEASTVIRKIVEEESLASLTDEEKANYEANEYKELRRVEYPDIGDQLDALYHAGVFPEDMANKIKAVKDKYPKNSED